MLESIILLHAICTNSVQESIYKAEIHNKYLRLFILLNYTACGGRGLVWLGHSP